MTFADAVVMCGRADAAYYVVYRKWAEALGHIPSGPPAMPAVDTFQECRDHVQKRLDQIEHLERELEELTRVQLTGSLALDLDYQNRLLKEVEKRYAR